MIEIDGFILMSKICELRPNYKKRVYFFARNGNDGRTIEKKIPKGYTVIKSPFTGLPMLASKKKLKQKKKNHVLSKSVSNIGSTIRKSGSGGIPIPTTHSD